MKHANLTSDNYDIFWADDWQDMKRYSPVGRHTRRWIRNLIAKVSKSPDEIRDIGCGDGSLLYELVERYPSVKMSGVDFSKEAVEICSKRHPSGEFRVHDLMNGKVPFEEPAHISVCSEVLEHIPDDTAALKNLIDSSKYLIITVPGGELDEMAKEMGHIRHYTASGLRAQCERLGLQVIYAREWGFPFAYPVYSRIRNRAGYNAVTGEYSKAKKFVSSALHSLFFVNDFFSGGNKVFLLGKNPENFS